MRDGLSKGAGRWWADWTAVLVTGLCAVLVAVALGPSLVGARVFASSDVLLSYAPWSASQPVGAKPDNACVSDPADGFIPAAAEFRRDVLKGDVAQWDPLASGGAPLGSVPSNAVWSPLSLPFIALPTWLAPAWVKLLEMLVSIGGMFLFLRRLNLARAPALLGGLVYATSGFMVSWTNWPHTRTAAFVPVLLWSLERLVQLRTPRAAAVVAVTVASLLLGGFPQVTGFAMYLAAPYLLLRVFKGRGPSMVARSKTALLGGLGVALGALVVAFQLLPFFSQVAGLDLSVRQQTPAQHLPLLSLVTAALPNAFGNCPDRSYVGPLNQIEVNAYAGTAVLVLVVVALLRRRRSETPAGVRGFFAVAALVTVVLGWIGGPLLGLAQHLPVFSNNPVGRIRVILGLCIAVLAAMGYDALLRARDEGKGRRWWLELLVWGGLAVVAAAVLVRLRNNLRPTHHLAASDRETLYAAIATAVVLVAVALARSRFHRAAVAVVPVVVLAQALNVVLPFWPQIPRHDFYPTTPAHEYLAQHLGHERFQGLGLAMFPGTNVYYGLRSLGGHAFTAPTWKDMMVSADPSAFRTPTFSTLDPTVETVTSPALDRLSVRYLVSGPEQPPFGATTRIGSPSTQAIVPAHGSLLVPFDGGPLRGVGIVLAAAPHADGQLSIDVLQGGRVLATSGRRLLPSTGEGDLPLALAGEDLPKGALSLRLRNSTAVSLSLAASSSTRPVLNVVRPVPDGLRVVQATPSSTVWERTRALPRVRWASTVTEVPQGPESLAAAAKTSAVAGHVLLARNTDHATGATGAVTVLKDGSDSLEVRVQADGTGYMVVADGLQTAWGVTVDGRAATLLKADHALVAVAVGPGEHTITLAYAPKYQRPGTVLSGLAVLGLLGLTLRRRKAPAQEG